MSVRLKPLAALLAAVSLASPALAQDKKPVELRYSSGAPPQNNPWAMQIGRFAKMVDEESKGELKIQPFLASALGSEQDTVQQVARGRIDMGGYSTGAAALIVPEVVLINAPGAFASVAQRDCVLDNHIKGMVADLFDKKGIKFLGWTEVGTVEIFGKKPLGNPKDFSGLKAAAYANKSSMLFFNTLGASPTPLGLPEWIPAFQTGMAEAVQTPITYALPSGLTKVAPVVTRLGLVYSPALTLINKGVFDKLAKPLQDALLRANERIPASQYRAEIFGFEKVLYGMHEKAGGQIVDITSEQRDVWMKTLEPFHAQLANEIGGNAKALASAIEAGRKACPK